MQAGTNALIIFILAILTLMFGLYGYYGSLNPCEMLAEEMESDLIRDSSINSSVDMLHVRLEARLTVGKLEDGQCIKALLRSRNNSYRDHSSHKKGWDEILDFSDEDQLNGETQIKGEEPE